VSDGEVKTAVELSFRHQAAQFYPGGLMKLSEIWRKYLVHKWEYVEK